MSIDTIAAIATGNDVSAIGIIRLSGPRAIEIANAVFTEQTGLAALDFTSRMLYYGTIRDTADAVLDRCLCWVARAPHSYTGEDTAEFQCHGGVLLLQLVLEALFAHGARQAEAGEFTKRAFLNGKLDLAQTEAIGDLIHAETAAAAKNAANGISGAIALATDAIYQSLASILAHFHAAVDYTDEDIAPFHLEAYRQVLREHANTLANLRQSHQRGQLLTHGIPTTIIGRPNAGKSSLLNALVGYDRAIVTATPGTTRDTVQARLCLGDTLLCLIDTAGLRKTDDAIELEGIARTRAAANEAKLLFAVFDGSAPLGEADSEVIEIANHAADGVHAIALINKSDLPVQMNDAPIRAAFRHILPVSAKTKTGIAQLESLLQSLYCGSTRDSGYLLTNPRQLNAVTRTKAHIEAAESAMIAGQTPDAVLTDLEAAMQALAELTGRTVRDDVIKQIFAQFCVGK